MTTKGILDDKNHCLKIILKPKNNIAFLMFYLTFAVHMQKTINILNKRARFDYEILDKYNAGIVLTGTEIKSIRLGKASITESFCEFHNNELFIINSHIEEYQYGTHYNHKSKSERKLLLNRKELKKLRKR